MDEKSDFVWAVVMCVLLVAMKAPSLVDEKADLIADQKDILMAVGMVE
jgi:hypothetical protein